jgi:glucose-1-phosphate cytidylyltransferase
VYWGPIFGVMGFYCTHCRGSNFVKANQVSGQKFNMKTVILAGGMGTRFAEETTTRPKPLIEIGGVPIIVHIMRIYAHHGINEFIVACGYLSHVMKNYFLNYYYLESDLTISLKNGTCSVRNSSRLDWSVSLVETGKDTMTGGRLLRLREWIGNDTFMCTYGDGVADINIEKLIEFHKSHGRLATVTSVHPPARFGNLVLDGNSVQRFAEKDQAAEAKINGGFFVFEPSVLDYIPGDDVPLERTPLANIARDGQLMAYQHEGFWQSMDTLRDQRYLEELWSTGRAPWKLWE